MKIITLNTWGNKAGSHLINDFYKKYIDTDVFCLQEVWDGGDDFHEVLPDAAKPKDIRSRQLSELKETLNNHEILFHPTHSNWFGPALCIKKEIPIIENGDIFVHKERGFIPTDHFGRLARNIQYAKLKVHNKELTIINFHGLWNGNGKDDTDERLKQSQSILDFIKTISGDFVLAGDFNLQPDSKSLKMFEEIGLRNLIKDFGITSTRTSYYKKPIKYADYIFLSPGFKVKEFKVLPEEVSDHTALYLEIK